MRSARRNRNRLPAGILALAVCLPLALGLAPHGAGAGYRLKVLQRFCPRGNCAGGERPSGGVTIDAAGNLYGTTSGDGKKTFGSVFEITP